MKAAPGYFLRVYKMLKNHYYGHMINPDRSEFFIVKT